MEVETTLDTFRRKSLVWNYFTAKEDSVATCNTCLKDYSYKSSISNLLKHYQRKHGQMMDTEHTDFSEEDQRGYNKVPISRGQKRSKPIYYDVMENEDFKVRCKSCNEDVHNDSIACMTAHVKQHNFQQPEDDPRVKRRQHNKASRSPVWHYMKPVEDGKAVECQLCHKQLSYKNSVSNLKKHIMKIHPNIKLEKSEPNRQGDDITQGIYDDEPKLDTVFPEFDRVRTRRPSNTDTESITYDVLTRSNRCSRETMSNISQPQIPGSRRQTSLSYFGQYIMSLLCELPNVVADQLQSGIIKQIIAAKVCSEAPTYSMTIVEQNPLNSSVANNRMNANENSEVNGMHACKDC